jgi:hypothetical protein
VHKLVKVLVWLCISSVLPGCAFNEVSGSRVPGAGPSTEFRSVDVVFADRAAMRPGGIGGLIGAPVPQGLTSRAGEDLPRLMRELCDGAAMSLSENRVAGRAILLSQYASQRPSAASHFIYVSMESAKLSPQSVTEFVLNVEVLDASNRRTLWKGTTHAYPGESGWTDKQRKDSVTEKRKTFGNSLVQALRDAVAMPR